MKLEKPAVSRPNTAWYHVIRWEDFWRSILFLGLPASCRWSSESWGSKGVGHSWARDGQVTKIARLHRFSMHAFNLWTFCDFRIIDVRRCIIWSILVFQFPLDAEALLRQEREALEVFFGERFQLFHGPMAGRSKLDGTNQHWLIVWTA